MNKDENPCSMDIYFNGFKKIKKILEKNKIKNKIFLPPLNSQKIYKQFKNLPNSNYYCKRGLWLPSSLDLNDKEIDKVCDILNRNII